jgi:hypothetical protein
MQYGKTAQEDGLHADGLFYGLAKSSQVERFLSSKRNGLCFPTHLTTLKKAFKAVNAEVSRRKAG